MILGGPALFLAGHAAFKLVVWRYLSWPRVAGIAVLALLGLAAKAIPELGARRLRGGRGRRRRRHRPPAGDTPAALSPYRVRPRCLSQRVVAPVTSSARRPPAAESRDRGESQDPAASRPR